MAAPHPDPSSEARRIKALRDLDMVENPPESHLDAVCRLAAGIFGVPIALVTLVDEATVWVKGANGSERDPVPRCDAFCTETIESVAGNALVLPDLSINERWRDSSLVLGGPHALFYAGVPIALESGLNIGTMCLMDVVPRPDFGDAQIEKLRDLANIVVAHLRLQEARVARERDDSRYRLLADNSTDVIVLSDLDGTRRYVSPAAKSVLGFGPEELVGTHPASFVHQNDLGTLRRNLRKLAMAKLEQGLACLRYRHKDGRWIWIEATFRLTRNAASGLANGFVSTLRDVSDRRSMEDTLRLSEERLSLALDSGSDGLWDWDIATGKVRLTGQWASILGYREDEIASDILAWFDLIHPDDVAISQRRLLAHLKGETDRLECEHRVRTKSGGYTWALARGRVVARDARGRALRLVGTKIDITRRKEAERQIEHMAGHDALTGLPNRNLFRERLAKEVADARRHDHIFAVLACDLDSFKNVNDTMGHSAGDVLLATVADRLKAVVRDGDMVARLGGDEFAIVLGHMGSAGEAQRIAQRVIEAIELPIEIDGHATSVSISVGIAIGHGADADAVQLFKKADIALYEAKTAGRNAYRSYETGMDVVLADRMSLERDMRDMLPAGGLTLDYQPVIRIGTGAVVGFEALMRWHHPTRGSIAPSKFIPIAEESGMIVGLGDWALQQACREAARWPDHVRVAVNVSVVQFRRPGLENSVMKALTSSGLSADRLELEITESVLVHDADAVIACLHRLRRLGVRIALDDFGTGYSSLNYLRQFPFDKIKIDRVFVQEIGDPNTAAIVRAVVSLAQRAGAAITAEGVETSEQLKNAARAGCTEVQGHLFSAPLRAEDASKHLERATRTAA